MTTSAVATDAKVVEAQYRAMAANNSRLRTQLGRPLTYSEKVLFNHLDGEIDVSGLKRGKSFVRLKPDRVAMQDATAQMALLQFIQSRRKQVAVPSTIHCDHLIRAHIGADADTKTAGKANAEVYEFLKTAASKYGIGFWGPGSGIIHQVVLENYAYPGCLLIGTDSHTPNGGGLGTVAIGVGGADAVDVMAGMGWELLLPKLLGVHLKGKLSGWTSSKDVILKVLEILTVQGGTNKIVEYFGSGANAISCTGKGTIANMGAELGATTSLFPCDEKMLAFLKHTRRSELADLASQYRDELCSDSEVLSNPQQFFDELYEIDLDTLEPYIVGPHSPDRARPISRFKDEIIEQDYPRAIKACLIGSCTNSSYEDLYKAHEVAKLALAAGMRAKVPLMITPGSMQIYSTIKRDGILQTLEEFGGKVLANACGPCIGQWQRDDIVPGERNSIVTSFNRNFAGRNDANPETLSFITSPEMVIAYAISGDLSFDPLHDSIGKIKIAAPSAPELPEHGFVADISGYHEPASDGEVVQVKVKPDSERLELLKPFPKWNGKDFKDHLLLLKVKGKCTTDHISPAGKWLKFRGHLDKISDNMFIGALNAFRKSGEGYYNQLSSKLEANVSQLARIYKEAGRSWVVVGEENYGEGSSREHAAMSPRFLGASAVIVKSFARIHETNLKKQGVLALTFENPNDYERIREDASISIHDLAHFAPERPIKVSVAQGGTDSFSFMAKHSYNAEQIAWFRAGSALNLFA